jgi:hypothetical protein
MHRQYRRLLFAGAVAVLFAWRQHKLSENEAKFAAGEFR